MTYLPLAAAVTGIGGTGFGIGYKVYRTREKEREAINRLAIEINELNNRVTRLEQNTNLILDKLVEKGIG